MIFKLFLNDLKKILSEIYEKIINYDEKEKRFSTVVATENATRYSKKKSNKFTWFKYVLWAHKIYLWGLDNKELISEIFHSIIDFVFE